MKRNVRFLAPFVTLVLLLASTAPASAQFRGLRYCEVLAVFLGQGGLVADVWNTTGFNLCPAADWEALDADSIRGELGAVAVLLNGPRYWMLDRLAGNVPQSDVRDFGALTMRRVATVEPPLGGAPTPYAPVSVNRDTQFFFDAGSEIYELLDPEGRVFVMQSYSQIVDPSLGEADLPSLGERLGLPEGWTYRVRVLEADLVVEDQDGVATVVQDELQNTYQLVAQAPVTACDSEPVIRTTPDGVEFVRTPDSCFDSLPGWPFAPEYVEIDGLRQAYVDEGPADGPVVLLLHGQPSWSYLYRKMIPVLVDGGYRVIAMDHLGLGRSDKPVDIASYSYLGHSDRLERFIEALDLRDINLFAQDWGSLIGLRVAGLNFGRFARIAVGNGTLPVIPEGIVPFPPVENPDEILDLVAPFAQIPPQQFSFYVGCDLLFPRDPNFFGQWMIYAMKARDFRPSAVVEALTWFDLPAEEEAAYDAPFPSRIHMAGPRVFPSLVNELPGTTAEAWDALTRFGRPFLTLWAANDPGGLGACETQQNLIDSVPGAANQPHDRLAEASHFLQDDQGPEIARRLVDFYASPVSECSDGIDNDVDGAADFGADFGCDAHDDESERAAELECDDGVDNDGDGRNDFDPATRADSTAYTAGSGDPGCIHPLGHEAPPCSDGLDNDEDGLADWDGAGLGDADPDCSGPDDYSEGNGCGLGFELALLMPLLLAARRRGLGGILARERSET